MKLKSRKHVPGFVAFAVILLVCAVASVRWDFFERLERFTFDLRARAALAWGAPVAPGLGFVSIDEDSVRKVWDGSLGYRFGLYWPRQVYGRLVAELALQGAQAVALDVILKELRPDHALVDLGNGQFAESDEFFARQMRQAGNVILALSPDVTPPDLFLTNAAALGDISTDKDSDGILRRARAFRIYRHWHRAFRQLAADPEYGVDLRQAKTEPGCIILPRRGLDPIRIPLDADGNFDLADFWGDKLPVGSARRAKPWSDERIWHMGIVLAAQELKLDLSAAEVVLRAGHIILRGPRGLERIIPVDADGYFWIDWSLPPNDPRLTQQPIQDLLAQYHRRLQGQTNHLVNDWRGRLAIVGSSALLGNNLTDRGAIPISGDTLLVSKHWNVANSVLTGRFVRRASLPLELLFIVLLGTLAAALTWRLRVLVASSLVAALIIGYSLVGIVAYIQNRYWLPLFLPILGACLLTHVSLVTWRVLFEQAERRRLRSIFATIVSPKIVTELLRTETLALGGARRPITVMFADMRGFTEFTDAGEERAAELVHAQSLSGRAAEACFDEQARETLATVNLYLGLVADTIIKHDGTLDKFIGDCVMAFWGAPTVHAQHAAACVRAAVEAQRAVYELNRQRVRENHDRQSENKLRQAAGLPPQPLLPVLFLGTGINSGMATVGLMGSEAKAVVRQGSFTVFGREVNLASRLEGAAGRGRILISHSTYQLLRRDDPALGSTVLPLPPITVKGIRTPVEVYEVPWLLPGTPPIEELLTQGPAQIERSSRPTSTQSNMPSA